MLSFIPREYVYTSYCFGLGQLTRFGARLILALQALLTSILFFFFLLLLLLFLFSSFGLLVSYLAE